MNVVYFYLSCIVWIIEMWVVNIDFSKGLLVIMVYVNELLFFLIGW